MPAISQIRPAFIAGITLQASTLVSSPSIETVIASGLTETFDPPNSDPIQSIIPL